MNDRPSKDQYYLDIARQVALRGTCLRRLYGAVIVQDDQIVSTGYAGAPRGVVNCVDMGRCVRQEMAVPPGQRYELCRSVHAEMNAVIHASRAQTLRATLYLVGVEKDSGELTTFAEPCLLCRRVIINAGIEKVIALHPDKGIMQISPADWIAAENQAAAEGVGLAGAPPMALTDMRGATK